MDQMDNDNSSEKLTLDYDSDYRGFDCPTSSSILKNTSGHQQQPSSSSPSLTLPTSTTDTKSASIDDSDSNLICSSSTTNQNKMSSIVVKNEPSDTDSLNKYPLYDNDRRNSQNYRNSRSRSHSRRHRSRSSSYRFRYHTDSDRSSVDDDDDDDNDDDDKSETERSKSESESDDSDDHYSKRYRHRSSSNTENRRNSNSNNWNSNKNEGRKPFNHRMHMNKHDINNHHRRRQRFNKHSRPNNRENHNYSSFYPSNPLSIQGNLYQTERLNLPSGSLFFPTTEPYNPEDAIFNQSLLNYGQQLSMNNNLNNNNGKLRRRQLVSVSINNENENEQQCSNNRNLTNDNNNQNILINYSGSQGNSLNNNNNQINNGDDNNNNNTTNHHMFTNNNSFNNNKLRNNRQQKFEKKKNFNKTSTLLIKKIPAHLNRIELLNDHFKKFGSIVNIKVGGADDLNPECALIRYQTPYEANRAYRSTEPVLNNRFIKVFWANQEQLSNVDDKLANTNKNNSTGMKSTNDNNTNLNIENTKRKNNDSKVYSQKKLRTSNTNQPVTSVAAVVTNSQIQTPIERKMHMMKMRELQLKSDEFNSKLKELLLNQRLLVYKFETYSEERKANVKKLINSNMASIDEIKQNLLEIQKQQLLQKNKLTQTSKIYSNSKKLNNIQKTSDNIASTANLDHDDDEVEDKNLDNIVENEEIFNEEPEPEIIEDAEEEVLVAKEKELEPEEFDFKDELEDYEVDYE